MGGFCRVCACAGFLCGFVAPVGFPQAPQYFMPGVFLWLHFEQIIFFLHSLFQM